MVSHASSDAAGQVGADASASEAPAREEEIEFSIGRYLARQRALRGISVDELSSLTRLPVRSIERLEAGSFDRDADGFVRGFVRTVAGALGLDPDETLTRMMREPSGSSPAMPKLGVGWIRLLLLGLAIAIVGASAGVVRSIAKSPASSPAEPTPQVIVRRDPVRALAESVRSGGEGSFTSLQNPQRGPADIGELLPPDEPLVASE